MIVIAYAFLTKRQYWRPPSPEEREYGHLGCIESAILLAQRTFFEAKGKYANSFEELFDKFPPDQKMALYSIPPEIVRSYRISKWEGKGVQKGPLQAMGYYFLLKGYPENNSWVCLMWPIKMKKRGYFRCVSVHGKIGEGQWDRHCIIGKLIYDRNDKDY